MVLPVLGQITISNHWSEPLHFFHSKLLIPLYPPPPLFCTGAEDQTDLKEDWTILRYGRLRQTDPEDGRSPSFLQGLPAKYTGNYSLRWH